MRIAALLLLAAASTAPAQESPAPTPMPTGEDLAFGVASDTRMTVPVQIAQAGPFRFVIDTGAQRTVISRELASTLQLADGPAVRLTAMTGASMVETVLIPSISVSTLGGKAIDAPLLEARNLGAAGLLGVDTLQGHAIGIDFERKVMSVTPSHRRGSRPPLLPDEIVVRAKSLLGQLVVTDAYCNGVRVRVVIDTGSAISMGNEALRRRVAMRAKPGQPILLTSVTGDSLTVPYSTIESVTFGGVSINQLPIAFADVPPFHQLGLDDKPAILLGMDALRLFRRVNIDFANRELRLLAPRGAMERGLHG